MLEIQEKQTIDERFANSLADLAAELIVVSSDTEEEARVKIERSVRFRLEDFIYIPPIDDIKSELLTAAQARKNPASAIKNELKSLARFPYLLRLIAEKDLLVSDLFDENELRFTLIRSTVELLSNRSSMLFAQIIRNAERVLNIQSPLGSPYEGVPVDENMVEKLGIFLREFQLKVLQREN